MITDMKAYFKDWHRKHPDYYQKDSAKRRTSISEFKLYARYGITQEVYNELFIKQEGKCAICQKHQSQLKRRLAVDHSHTSGKVRGLLCFLCNAHLVAFLENSPHLIIKGKEYLDKFKEAR